MSNLGAFNYSCKFFSLHFEEPCLHEIRRYVYLTFYSFSVVKQLLLDQLMLVLFDLKNKVS